MPSKLHSRCLLIFALGLGLSMLSQQRIAVSAEPDDVLAPLVATPIISPNPVLGADNKLHLVYEIVLVNMGAGDVSLKKVEALDASGGAVLDTMEGGGLTQMLKLNGGSKGATLLGGGSGILFMDVKLGKDATVPKAIRHRFDIDVAKTVPAQGGEDHDPVPESSQAIVVTGGPLAVGPAAVVIAPPLRGPHWVAGGGCCAPPSYHRGATLPINVAMHVAERFAIDFVQLNDKNMLIKGPIDQLSSYAYFGDEIYSVADGTVVGAEDGLPEEVPGKLPEHPGFQMAGGNHVVVDIGEGRFAFYAHMQPGSVRLKAGDKVKTGQVLGLLGNSGNTDTPHLHFHVMDGPSPLVSNGLPYVFTGFTGQGQLTDEQPLWTGGAVTVNKDVLAGSHENQLPLAGEVVSFP